MEWFINDQLGSVSYEIDEAPHAKAVLLIAHGAGAGMHHPFMAQLAGRIAEQGFHAARFNFPYMEQGRKSPGSPKSNIATWREAVRHTHSQYPRLPVFVSGKSYGGRMASHLLAEEGISDIVRGVIYFGFPLHAPGRDSKDRAAHLPQITQPQLFLQGERETLANQTLIEEVVADLSNAHMEIIDFADHSFNVPKKSGRTKEDVMDFLTTTSADWMTKQLH